MRTTPRFDLIVLAASAGGIEAVSTVLGSLPADFPVPIALVQHRRDGHLLPLVLARRTVLRVKEAEAGEPIRPGTVYVAPADWHLTVTAERTFSLQDGNRIRFVRSSAIPLFSSAAHVIPGRVIAVVLTGGGTDGSDGVQAVKASGGIVIAQDQATSHTFGMPRAAIQTGCVDHVLPLKQIGPKLVELVSGEKHRSGADLVESIDG